MGGCELRSVALTTGSAKFDLHLLTLEALAPVVDCANPYRECCAFRHDVADFCSYGGDTSCTGKSIGVISHPTLAPHGPHHFRTESSDSAAAVTTRTSDTQLVVPPAVGVILHFESAHFGRWLDKFTDYAQRMRDEGMRAIGMAKKFTHFYSQSIAVCMQRMETARAMRESNSITAALLGHFSASDGEASAREFWSANKLEPPTVTRQRPVHSLSVLGSDGLTLLPPPARSLGPLPAAPTCAVGPAATALDAADAAIRLHAPRSRWWRILHEGSRQVVVVREDTSLASRMCDLKRCGEEVEVDAEADGADGRWVRLAEPYPNGTSGWILIDGTKLGLGVLLEPRTSLEAHSATGRLPAAPQDSQMAAPAAEPPTVGVPARPMLSLTALLQRAALPPSYVSRLCDAAVDGGEGGGDGSAPQSSLEDVAAPLRCSAPELAQLCRRAKLPVGHRLKLVQALERELRR